jgi:hypothetical protein
VPKFVGVTSQTPGPLYAIRQRDYKMELIRNTQVTLVAYHGTKTVELSDFIRVCQDKLAGRLLSGFRPYDIEQVHGTIIGLEGDRIGEEILNKNFQILRGEKKSMDIDQILDFLRSTDALPIQIRIGGFRPYDKYPFNSRGQHPYFRSFSVQGQIAVAMGWPVIAEQYPNSLHKLRWELQKFNILHKYHKHPDDVDNDFFFVLGRVDRDSIKDIVIQEVEETLRAYLAGLRPIVIPVGKEQLSIVGYLDPQLPTATSISFSLTDKELDGKRIRNLYLANGI